MQNIFKYTLLSVLFMSGVSCKKSNPTSYDQPAMIYVYKDGFNTNRDSITYSFAVKNDALLVDTVKIPVRIMGKASSSSREVKLAPVAALSNAVEGTNYSLLPYVIPAGAYTAELPVVVKRTTDIKNKELRLVLEIKESKDFITGATATANSAIPGADSRYLVKINDFITKPSYWDSFTIFYFGTFSAVKYKFMIQTVGSADFKSPEMNGSQATYLNLLCKNALTAYEAINGPLLDEFGVRVTFL